MKQRLSILFLSLATLAVLIAEFIPHHHHSKGMACLEIRNFENKAPRKEQTNENAQTCVAKSFFITKIDSRARKRIATNDSDNLFPQHLLPILYTIADFFRLSIEEDSNHSDYGESIILYQSAEANQFHGLRAPPFSVLSPSCRPA